MSFGGSAPNPIPGVGGVANQFKQATTNYPGADLGKQLDPLYQKAGTTGFDLWSSPAAKRAITGAKSAATMGGNVASSGLDFSKFMLPGAKSFLGAGQSLLPQAQSMLDLGLDPQNALYDRTLHQTQEQQRVGQSARGIDMSPYGAGLENDALKNFNIDWQKGALDRAAAGAQGAESLYGAANNLATEGSNLGTSAFDLGKGATDLRAGSALLPYTTKRDLNTDRMTALDRESSGITNANQPLNQVVQDFLSYLNAGVSGQNAATAQAQQQQAAPMALLQMIPGLLGK